MGREVLGGRLDLLPEMEMIGFEALPSNPGFAPALPPPTDTPCRPCMSPPAATAAAVGFMDRGWWWGCNWGEVKWPIIDEKANPAGKGIGAA